MSAIASICCSETVHVVSDMTYDVWSWTLNPSIAIGRSEHSIVLIILRV